MRGGDRTLETRDTPICTTAILLSSNLPHHTSSPAILASMSPPGNIYSLVGSQYDPNYVIDLMFSGVNGTVIIFLQKDLESFA